MKRLNVKEQKGAVTLLVLITILFFVTVLISLYIFVSGKAQSQLELAREVQRIYESERAEDVYYRFFGENIVPIYNVEQLLAIGTEKYMPIAELGGQMYYFSKTSIYVLMNDLEFEFKPSADEQKMPSGSTWIPIGNRYSGEILEVPISDTRDLLGVVGSEKKGRFEGNGKKIVVNGNVNWDDSYEFNMENGYKYEEWSKEYLTTAKYVDRNGKTAWIPRGYQVSLRKTMNRVDTGLVIRNAEDRNEFVWIPVANINDMIIPNGVGPGEHAGQLYAFTNNGATANKDPLTYTANSGKREPDVITGNSTGNGTIYDGATAYLSQINYANTIAMKANLQVEFNKMVESVKKYKGFYVGRYETGDLSKSKVVSKRGNTDIHSQIWYVMYQKQKELYNKSTDSAVSGMIWGCQYDQMLKNIYASDNTKSLTNSSSWGNYLNSTFSYNNNGTTTTKALNTATRVPTGSTERNKAYNVYDVAGNVAEWTLEAMSTDRRTHRGGYYSADSSTYSAGSYGDGTPDNSYDRRGSRLQIYIKPGEVITDPELPPGPDETEFLYAYTGGPQTFDVPMTGRYKLEVWGAQGGVGSSSSLQANYGGYASGEVTLTAGETLYVYVGGRGNVGGRAVNVAAPGGYNGGGSVAATSGTSDSHSGGGATDIRLVGGAWNNSAGLFSRIIVAGGAGGPGNANNWAQTTANTVGTYGGSTGTRSGAQNAAGTVSNATAISIGGFGFGASGINVTGDDQSAGGGGWYGGGSNGDSYGGGGSNYVLTSTSYKPGSYNVAAKYYMTNDVTKAGNQSMPTHNGAGTMTGNAGNGYARITWVGP